MPDFIVSNSEIQNFKACRRQWYLRYVRGLRKPETPVGALALGTAVHEALGAYYSENGTLFTALRTLDDLYTEKMAAFPYSEDSIQKDYRMASVMVEGYVQYCEEEGVDSNLIILESEAEIEADVTLPSGIVVRILGKRDLIGMDEHERRFFLDFKTCQSLGDSLLDINEQLLTYALLEKINAPESLPEYAIWRMLRKVLRTERSKPPYFAEEKIELSDRVLRNFYLRLSGTLEDMARTKAQLVDSVDHRVACYPTASSRCSWGCEFRLPCPMLDRDEYAEEFLTNNYVIHNPYERYEAKGVIE